MKKKPELDDIDVLFDPTPLSEQEKKLISEYIFREKAKRRTKHYTKFWLKHTEKRTAK